MKINVPELAHYIIGGLALIGITPTLMKYFPVQADQYMTMAFAAFAIAWILAYIIIDQFLHVVIKKEPINIVE